MSRPAAAARQGSGSPGQGQRVHPGLAVGLPQRSGGPMFKGLPILSSTSGSLLRCQGLSPCMCAGQVVKCANLRELRADGSAMLDSGVALPRVDVVILCTGYSYSFPFLEGAGIVSVEDNRVGPLYQHVFPPAHAPFLSFVGLPFKVRDPGGGGEEGAWYGPQHWVAFRR